MKTYYRIMPGAKSVHDEECFNGNFIGADYGITDDLTDRLPDEWRDFNAEFIPIYLAKFPDKTKIAAGLACGMLWTVAKGVQKGDVVLCPNGLGQYRVAEIVGDYYHAPGQILPHRRTVQWLPPMIDRNSMSQGLKNTTGSIGMLMSAELATPTKSKVYWAELARNRRSRLIRWLRTLPPSPWKSTLRTSWCRTGRRPN